MIEIESGRFKTYRMESWRDFDDYDPQSVQCGYRGQGGQTWRLWTAYERRQRVQNPMREQKMLDRFISQAGIYVGDLPTREDYVSWFSLMQHYGTGTRLLDVTRSRYVAMFFALTGMIDSGCKEDGVVWVFKTYGSNLNFYNALMTTEASPCLDVREDPLTQSLEEYKTLGRRFANEFIRSDWGMEIRDEISDGLVKRHRERMKPFLEEGGVMQIVPAKTNKRMVAQAAEFLMPITLRKSFEENLCSKVCGWDGKRCVPGVAKLIIPKEMIDEFWGKLNEMNITYQTIYPGIEGLAMSVNYNY